MGKSILITGCSSGIGRATAYALRARGHQVFASARKPTDVEQLRSDGLNCVQLDVADSRSIGIALDKILAQTGGRLDAVFNNAGFAITGAVEDIGRDVLRLQLETNLLGAHELITRILPVMRRQGSGRIIQCSSLLGLVALPFRGPYSASKFALEALSDCLRLELRGSGIHVSLIEPGPILTRFRANALALFEQYIDVEHSHHRAKYQRTLQRLRSKDAAVPFTLGPDAVTKKVIHALESARPRARYPVTVPTYALALMRRLLPTRALDVLAGHRL